MRTIIQYLNNIFLPLLPDTRFFGFKRGMWRLAGVEIGKNVRICSSVTISGTGKLSIGDNTWVGPQAMICSSNRVSIGANCDIAPRVYIGDGTHEITPDRERIAGVDATRPVSIGNGCWICANAIVLAGVSIADKCVVAAGAVVANAVRENQVLIAGVPASVKKRL